MISALKYCKTGVTTHAPQQRKKPQMDTIKYKGFGNGTFR